MQGRQTLSVWLPSPSGLPPPSSGLDTCLSIMRVLHTQFGDSKYRPCPLLQQYVDGGWLGVKTGDREGRDIQRISEGICGPHGPSPRCRAVMAMYGLHGRL